MENDITQQTIPNDNEPSPTKRVLQLPSAKRWYAQPFCWQLAAAAAALVACIVILVLGLADVNGWQRTKARVHQTAEGVRVDLVTADGTHYDNVPLNEVNSGWKEGQIIRVRYKTEGDVVVKTYSSTIVLGVCLAVAALVLGALGTSMLRDEKRRQKRLQHVKEAGEPVEATVLSVFPDYMGLRKRDRLHFSRLDCAYYPPKAQPQRESGQDAMWIFTSERFITPSHQFKGRITVWVVMDNPDDYYVDISSLQVDEVEESGTDVPPII